MCALPLLELGPAPGTLVERLLDPGPEARLGVVRTNGAARAASTGAVLWVLIEGGRGTLTVASEEVTVGGRSDVFEEPGWSALVPPGAEVALDGSLRATWVWRHADDPIDGGLIAPDAVAEETQGDGVTRRQVRTYVDTGPLIAGETLTKPGGWAGWPPRRHEAEDVALYRFDPPDGFGVHVAYDERGDRPVVVRDGSIQRVTSGWHPAVAAPGFAMYSLWARAGDRHPAEARPDPR